MLTTHPHPAPRLKKEYSYTFSPLYVFMAGYRVKFTLISTTLSFGFMSIGVVMYKTVFVQDRGKWRDVFEKAKTINI